MNSFQTTIGSMVSDEIYNRYASELVSFISNSPTPFHVVETCKSLLKSNDFHELSPKSEWNISTCGKYFVTVNNTCIIAFAVGGSFKAGNGLSILATHTDSPCFKLKKNFSSESCGIHTTTVEPYGGGIWGTWFDRDLTVAGRVVSKNSEGGLCQKLIHIKRPILRIPHVAIHLDRSKNEKFAPCLEKHCRPILASKFISSQHLTSENDSSPLMNLISKEVDSPPENILGIDLSVVDFQEPCIGGLFDEFIFAPRLDNLFNTFSAVKGIIQSLEDGSISDDPNIRIVACFDNEEIGSDSVQGAASGIFSLFIRRILACLNSEDQYERTICNSFLLSADQAHAIHPNYSELHQENHSPELHKGCVIKHHADQSYATSGFTGSVIELICQNSNVPYQHFSIKNDMRCGSTIGPIIATGLGIHTCDIGFPMLSMHSLREMCCVSSVYQAVLLYLNFFKTLPSILSKTPFY